MLSETVLKVNRECCCLIWCKNERRGEEENEKMAVHNLSSNESRKSLFLAVPSKYIKSKMSVRWLRLFYIKTLSNEDIIGAAQLLQNKNPTAEHNRQRKRAANAARQHLHKSTKCKYYERSSTEAMTSKSCTPYNNHTNTPRVPVNKAKELETSLHSTSCIGH